MNRLGDPPHVCLITPGKLTSENYFTESLTLLDSLRSAVDDRVSMVQIREKDLPARLQFELVRDAVNIARSSSTLIIVNDRADIAVAAKATGVHLPESSLRPHVVRSVFERLLIGKSVHSVDAAVKAAEDGADYIMFAPVFETPGKGPAAGLEKLAQVRDAVPNTPVIALGGIDEHNCTQPIQAGAAGVAAIRSLNEKSTRQRVLAALR